MNPHRQHPFIEHTRLADRSHTRIAFGWAGAFAAIALAAVGAAIVIALTQPVKSAAVEPTPIPTPWIVATDLPTLDRETGQALARIDGFRTGYAMAIERGCGMPVLSSPIAQQP
jgi:hypothetical protein